MAAGPVDIKSRRIVSPPRVSVGLCLLRMIQPPAPRELGSCWQCRPPLRERSKDPEVSAFAGQTDRRSVKVVLAGVVRLICGTTLPWRISSSRKCNEPFVELTDVYTTQSVKKLRVRSLLARVCLQRYSDGSVTEVFVARSKHFKRAANPFSSFREFRGAHRRVHGHLTHNQQKVPGNNN